MLKLMITASATPSRHVEIEASALAGEGVIVGRLERSGLVIEDPSVSRMHARLLVRDGALHVEDLGSRAGSMLNGVRLMPRQWARLAQEDVLTLGACSVTLLESVKVAVNDGDSETMMAPPPVRSYLPLWGLDAAAVSRWTEGEIAVRVVAVRDETDDVKTFAFAAEPPVLFTYLPGQFATLHLRIDGKPITRSYTISSSPTRPHLLTITVKRVPAADRHAPGLVSNWLHDNLRKGDRLTLSGPYGDFTCAAHPAPEMLLISGGSGITPMLSMVRWLTDSGARADTVFLHGARSSGDLIARRELEVLATHNPYLRLLFITSRPEPGSAWPGISGRITLDLLSLAVPDFSKRQVFCCGPAPFMQGIKDLLTKAGFPMDRYHEESFGGAKKTPTEPVGTETSSAPAFGLAAILRGIGGAKRAEAAVVEPAELPAAARAAEHSVITCTRSKRTIPCPEGSTLLEAIEGASITWPSGCRMGKCGACKVKLLSGKLDPAGYDDAILKPTDRSAGFVLACIGKCAGAVTLDA